MNILMKTRQNVLNWDCLKTIFFSEDLVLYVRKIGYSEPQTKISNPDFKGINDPPVSTLVLLNTI